MTAVAADRVHDHDMKGEGAERDRRRAVRVGARGRIVLHGGRLGHGKILDLSASGVRIRLAGPAGGYVAEQRVLLDLRLDGAAGGRWRLSGRITRVAHESEIAIAFDAVPTDFESWVQAEPWRDSSRSTTLLRCASLR
jgi:hypothetical protein